jgi:transcriptional regulator with XRE-family HTH domain
MSPRRFAMRLRQRRQQRGMTQEMLVRKCGVSRDYHDPTLSRVRKLAKAFGVPVTELLG